MGIIKKFFMFRIDFEKKKNIPAHVLFKFAGLKSYLVGFQIPSPFAK